MDQANKNWMSMGSSRIIHKLLKFVERLKKSNCAVERNEFLF